MSTKNIEEALSDGLEYARDNGIDELVDRVHSAIAELGALRLACRVVIDSSQHPVVMASAKHVIQNIGAEPPVSVADYYEKEQQAPTAHELAESAVEEYRAMRNDPYKAPEVVEEFRLAAERAVAAAKASEERP